MAIEVLPGQQASLRDLIEESRSGEPKLLNLHWEEFHSGVERFLKAVSSSVKEDTDSRSISTL